METSLGKWGSWEQPAETGYTRQLYDNGQQCWNGPKRSAHVSTRLRADRGCPGDGASSGGRSAGWLSAGVIQCTEARTQGDIANWRLNASGGKTWDTRNRIRDTVVLGQFMAWSNCLLVGWASVLSLLLSRVKIRWCELYAARNMS